MWKDWKRVAKRTNNFYYGKMIAGSWTEKLPHPALKPDLMRNQAIVEYCDDAEVIDNLDEPKAERLPDLQGPVI